MSRNKAFVLTVLIILMTPVVMGLGIIAMSMAFAQTPNTTPAQTTIQGPNGGNIQFLPQQAYIVPLPPAGVQSNSQTFGGGDGGLMGLISGVVAGGLGGIYAKIRGDKNQETSQKIASTQSKIAAVQQGTLEQVYENMPNKGNEITNKPVIKLSNVESIKDEALKNASKA